MAVKSFRRVRTEDGDIKQLQDAVANTLQTITQREILDGVLLTDIYVATGAARDIEHKLGRKPRGYVVVKRDAESEIWDSESDLPNSFLSLNSSANVTISLWVF